MVHPRSERIPRVRPYSGYCRLLSVFAYMTLTFFGMSSHTFRLTFSIAYTVRTPGVFLLPVWPPPLSLATTCGISVDFFSSPYLDVSVQAVPLPYLFDSVWDTQSSTVWIAPFGHLRFITSACD